MIAWGGGLRCEACTIIQCEDPGIGDALTAVTLVCWAPQDGTCPRGKGVPAQYYSTRLCTALHTGQCWLFTAWVQLLVFKDTVALFQYQLGLWGIFFFF